MNVLHRVTPARNATRSVEVGLRQSLKLLEEILQKPPCQKPRFLLEWRHLQPTGGHHAGSSDSIDHSFDCGHSGSDSFSVSPLGSHNQGELPVRKRHLQNPILWIAIILFALMIIGTGGQGTISVFG
ncbi:MAG: hypothetical protein Q8O53_03135 [Candidatus Moranbacteria bacterium]|nr:hypothetical protein [Candidatus Moranbacteria bacterium]